MRFDSKLSGSIYCYPGSFLKGPLYRWRWVDIFKIEGRAQNGRDWSNIIKTEQTSTKCDYCGESFLTVVRVSDSIVCPGCARQRFEDERASGRKIAP
jgi:hypothetical protein